MKRIEITISEADEEQIITASLIEHIDYHSKSTGAYSKDITPHLIKVLGHFDTELAKRYDEI